LAPFSGREKELNEIQRYLEDPAFPVVTLKGPGGIGKTRLADEIEHRTNHQSPVTNHDGRGYACFRLSTFDCQL